MVLPKEKGNMSDLLLRLFQIYNMYGSNKCHISLNLSRVETNSVLSTSFSFLHRSSHLPKKLAPLRRTVENIKDPLYRFFEREFNLGCKILNRVHADLCDVSMICRAEKKPTNDHRAIISELTRGMIPKVWLSFWFVLHILNLNYLFLLMCSCLKVFKGLKIFCFSPGFCTRSHPTRPSFSGSTTSARGSSNSRASLNRSPTLAP